MKLHTKLRAWSGITLFASAPLLLDTWPPFRDIGKQFVFWGLITWGLGKHAEKSEAVEGNIPTQPHTPNKFLPVAMVASSIYLLKHARGKWQGHGIGLLIQAVFLFMLTRLGRGNFRPNPTTNTPLSPVP
ncbi:MAG TPA: hypothetical protein ENJ56_04165 [Anaerolineae bacterium]|nr:hypothetical protein [Anaerolineae bacterium]